jgi:hypothetical protein
MRTQTPAIGHNGKAISTEHAQMTNGVSQEKFELNYQVNN